MNIFQQIIKTGDLVFDVGSNIGDKSEVFLSLGASVVAFEPQKECYDYAVSRFKGNPKYLAENIALDAKEATASIRIASANSISSMSDSFIAEVKKIRFHAYSWGPVRQVATNTLDNMIKKYGNPSFIKIDVEGFELNVLKGLSTPVGVISVEFTPELCSASVLCIDYIDDLNKGKTVFNYGYRNDEHFKFSSWLSRNQLLEYLNSVDDYRFEFGDIYCMRLDRDDHLL